MELNDRYIIFENGLIKPTYPAKTNVWLWDGLFSRAETKGRIMTFLEPLMHQYKNIILTIPLADGYDGITGLNGWDSDNYKYEKYLRENNLIDVSFKIINIYF